MLWRSVGAATAVEGRRRRPCCGGASSPPLPWRADAGALAVEKPLEMRPPPPLSTPTGVAATHANDPWTIDPRPPGGFLNYFQHPQFSPFPSSPHPSNFPPPQQGYPSPENSHFVGVPQHFAAFSPPPALHTAGAPSMCTSGKDHGSSNRVASRKKKQVVNVDDDDDDDEPGRTAQRLSWSHEEDKKLANAWLENSNDPIDGNNKKNEKYWEDIAIVYNSTMPKDRRRGARQLKFHFHHVKAHINAFHGQWCSFTKVYRSGYYDDQLTNMTLEKYQVTYSKPFVLLHMWRVLKNQGKWLAYIKKLKEEEKKSTLGGIDLTSHVVDVDDEQRPIGCKSAKAERTGKRKARDMPEGLAVLSEKLDKFIEVQAEFRQQRQRVIEVQQQISTEKLEIAKLQKETKMLDVYNNLLLADTSGMDENAKAQHAKTLLSMGSMLFGL